VSSLPRPCSLERGRSASCKTVKLYKVAILANVVNMAQMAPLEIPASEVRGQISQVISRVAFGGERIVISRNGNEKVAVVPMADLERLVEYDRQRAAEGTAALQRESARNGTDKLTDEEIDAEIAAVRHARRSRPR
jgi:prevent-host-death family protein